MRTQRELGRPPSDARAEPSAPSAPRPRLTGRILPARVATARQGPHPFTFFGALAWLDGRPLMHTIEPYRRAIFESVLWSFDDDGRPRYNMALLGRAKKNYKTSDMVLAALYRLLAWRSAAGNDCFILANDEGQANDDLGLAKKLVAANPVLAREVTTAAKAIIRRDGMGSLTILPAQDVAGSHGKTYLFIGYDEIHAYKSHDLFEALAPDPTRPDVLTWVTSYAGIRHAPGIPLYDFVQAGKRGDDPRMFFSWYSADFGTDPAFRDLPTPEERANPSIAAFAPDYLAQQRKRLPAHKYRRLHLNLPGAPDGAAFSGEHVMSAIAPGRKRIAPQQGVQYFGFVDMSGGSNDDAVLGISHRDESTNRAVLDMLVSQTGEPPFNPRHAVAKFAAILKEYNLLRVVGDAYAGETFRADFGERGIGYEPSERSKHELYEALEPRLNAGEAELLDIGELQEQLLTLVWRGAKIDHQPGDHDDFANAAAGALYLASDDDGEMRTWRKLGASPEPGPPQRYAPRQATPEELAQIAENEAAQRRLEAQQRREQAKRPAAPAPAVLQTNLLDEQLRAAAAAGTPGAAMFLQQRNQR